MSLVLKLETLTHDAFAPFGDVIEASEHAQQFSINDGNTQRYHDLAEIDPGADGQAIVSIFRGQPRTLPFTVTMMERHPKGSQAFIPMSNQPYLVVVAPKGEAPTCKTSSRRKSAFLLLLSVNAGQIEKPWAE